MAKYVVRQSGALEGDLVASGSKNAVLPLMAASLLTNEKCRINDTPALRDVEVLCHILEDIGGQIRFNKEEKYLDIETPEIRAAGAAPHLAGRMRASVLILGPLLARIGKATVALPGGCAIGARPIDLHLKGLEAMGASVQTFTKDGFDFVEATADHLKGCEIYLDFPSVGATQNLIMAAALAEGTTLIQNAAEEPEIVDLANFLNKMGAKVKGAGTDNIRIEGVKALHGTEHTVIPDRIETGTFMVAAAISGGNLTIHNTVASHLTPISAKLRETGVDVFEGEDFIRVDARGKALRAVNIKTLPYPGFPTDMQAQFMALLSVAKGKGTINETVFENRFMHIDQLRKMGADITYADRKASIIGTKHLHGARVRATDLRAGAALVLAGLVAEGTTEVSQVYYIERGYEEFVEKMKSVGADIEYVDE